jgi:hypothetical protein
MTTFEEECPFGYRCNDYEKCDECTHKNCLDKQRVRETLYKIIPAEIDSCKKYHTQFHGGCIYCTIKKELNL